MKTDWFPNTLNKVLLHNEQEYIDLILSLKDKFPSLEHFESHFGMTPYDEDTHPEEYLNGILRPETTTWKPEFYPCLYVVVPVRTDDCRGFGGVDGFWDDFIYITDLIES